MSKEAYIRLMNFISHRKPLKQAVEILYKLLPVFMFIGYPLIVIVNGFSHSVIRLALAIGVPALTLGVSLVMRRLVNRQRPYEKFNASSIIKKEKKGQSFPSNHSVCAFVIAMSGFSVNPTVGIVLSVIALMIALTRIFSGVHYISDVIAGSLIGLTFGAVFIFL